MSWFSWITKIPSVVTGLPWLQIGAFAGIGALILFGVHRIGLSYTYEQQNAQYKSDEEAIQTKAQEEAATAKQRYDTDMKVMTDQTNYALNIARTATAQLEDIKHEQPSDDSFASPVLTNTIEWVRQQPDPYTDTGDSTSAASSATPKGRAPSCGTLRQSDVATFIVNQFAALDQARSQLASLRQWSVQHQ